MNVAFSSIHPTLVVSHNPDGSYSWSGQYNGADIKRALPSDDGEHCILLLDPDASKSSVFENLLCIDRQGSPIWAAKLPSTPDAFVDVKANAAGLVATTWSGWNIFLDQNTGTELKRVFVK